MEQRGLLAKEEVIRSFAPVGQREKHMGNYHLNNMEWLAEVKHKKNCNMPQN